MCVLQNFWNSPPPSLVSLATDGMAAIPASEFGSGCQGDGAAAVPDLFSSGRCIHEWVSVYILALFVLKTIDSSLASIIDVYYGSKSDLITQKQ